MSYPVDNAIFQWEEGERRLREAPDTERADLERAMEIVIDELKRRLGSSFNLEELGDLYASDVDWASELAHRYSAGTDSSWVVDAAFSRYAREATNFGGGRKREVF